MAKKKYFKTRSSAKTELAKRKSEDITCIDQLFKIPKGTRHSGEYAVCSELEYLNTY